MLRYSVGCCELFSKSYENIPRVSATGRRGLGGNKNEQSSVILEKKGKQNTTYVYTRKERWKKEEKKK